MGLFLDYLITFCDGVSLLPLGLEGIFEICFRESMEEVKYTSG